MMAKRVPIDTYCEKKIPTLQKTYDGLIDYVDISSVDNTEKKIISYQTIESNDAPSRAKQLLKKGDVLVSTVRPNLNAVAVVEEETENLMVGSTGYCVLRCKDNMDVRYLFNFCQSQYFVDDMSSQATGASYPAVSNGIVRSALIPCYSIEEQREIAEKMDTVSELLALRKQQLSELDELIKSRFVELFGDPVDNPMGWTTKQLQELVTDDCTISYGIVQTGDDQEDGIPVFRPVDIVNHVPIRSELKKTTEEISNKYKRTILKGREMLITVRANIADTCIVGEEFTGCNVGRGIVPIRTREDEMILEFLKYQIDSKHLNDNIKALAKGITLIQLNMEDLREVTLIVPPIEKQKSFVEFARQTDKSKLAVQQSIAELEELKKSLMQKYFG